MTLPGLVTANELMAPWGWKRTTQELFPELIARLIQASQPDVHISFPSGDAIANHGKDGIVTNPGIDTPRLPSGQSYWECGTDIDAAKKVKKDYKSYKNSKDPNRANITLVFCVSGNISETAKKALIKVETLNKQWKGMRVLSSDDVYRWLIEFPSIHLWFSQQIGFHPAGLTRMEQIVEDWSNSTDPIFPADLLLNFESLEQQQRLILEKIQTDKDKPLYITGDKEKILPWLGALLEQDTATKGKGIVIDSEISWRGLDLGSKKENLILIPTFKYVFKIEKNKQDHKVVILKENRIRDDSSLDAIHIEFPKEMRLEAIRKVLHVKDSFINHSDEILMNKNFWRYRKLMLTESENSWEVFRDGPLGSFALMLVNSWSEENSKDTKAIELISGVDYPVLENWLYTHENEHISRDRHTWRIELAQASLEKALQKMPHSFLLSYLRVAKKYLLKKEIGVSTQLLEGLTETLVRISMDDSGVRFSKSNITEIKNLALEAFESNFDTYIKKGNLVYSEFRWMKLLCEANPRGIFNFMKKKLKNNKDLEDKKHIYDLLLHLALSPEIGLEVWDAILKEKAEGEEFEEVILSLIDPIYGAISLSPALRQESLLKLSTLNPALGANIALKGLSAHSSLRVFQIGEVQDWKPDWDKRHFIYHHERLVWLEMLISYPSLPAGTLIQLLKMHQRIDSVVKSIEDKSLQRKIKTDANYLIRKEINSDNWTLSDHHELAKIYRKDFEFNKHKSKILRSKILRKSLKSSTQKFGPVGELLYKMAIVEVQYKENSDKLALKILAPHAKQMQDNLLAVQEYFPPQINFGWLLAACGNILKESEYESLTFWSRVGFQKEMNDKDKNYQMHMRKNLNVKTEKFILESLLASDEISFKNIQTVINFSGFNQQAFWKNVRFDLLDEAAMNYVLNDQSILAALPLESKRCLFESLSYTKSQPTVQVIALIVDFLKEEFNSDIITRYQDYRLQDLIVWLSKSDNYIQNYQVEIEILRFIKIKETGIEPSLVNLIFSNPAIFCNFLEKTSSLSRLENAITRVNFNNVFKGDSRLFQSWYNGLKSILKDYSEKAQGRFLRHLGNAMASSLSKADTAYLSMYADFICSEPLDSYIMKALKNTLIEFPFGHSKEKDFKLKKKRVNELISILEAVADDKAEWLEDIKNKMEDPTVAID